jgi:hypothetical protein
MSHSKLLTVSHQKGTPTLCSSGGQVMDPPLSCCPAAHTTPLQLLCCSGSKGPMADALHMSVQASIGLLVLQTQKNRVTQRCQQAARTRVRAHAMAYLLDTQKTGISLIL